MAVGYWFSIWLGATVFQVLAGVGEASTKGFWFGCIEITDFASGFCSVFHHGLRRHECVF